VRSTSRTRPATAVTIVPVSSFAASDGAGGCSRRAAFEPARPFARPTSCHTRHWLSLHSASSTDSSSSTTMIETTPAVSTTPATKETDAIRRPEKAGDATRKTTTIGRRSASASASRNCLTWPRRSRRSRRRSGSGRNSPRRRPRAGCGRLRGNSAAELRRGDEPVEDVACRRHGGVTGDYGAECGPENKPQGEDGADEAHRSSRLLDGRHVSHERIGRRDVAAHGAGPHADREQRRQRAGDAGDGFELRPQPEDEPGDGTAGERERDDRPTAPLVREQSEEWREYELHE